MARIILCLIVLFLNTIFTWSFVGRGPRPTFPSSCLCASRALGGLRSGKSNAPASFRLYKRLIKENKVFDGRVNNQRSTSPAFASLKLASTTSQMHDEGTVAVANRVCEASFRRMSEKHQQLLQSQSFSTSLNVEGNRRYSLSEQIDDEIVESVVTLKLNGEIVFLESHGGPACKTLQGSWYVDPVSNLIRMAIDRTYVGNYVELNVRSHYSGFATSSNDGLASYSSALININGEVCDEVGCVPVTSDGSPAGWFNLCPLPEADF